MRNSSHPLYVFLHQLLVSSPLPTNISYVWGFGSLLGILLVVQLVTGICLVTHYTPSADGAFDSVELIMREVHIGWTLRYLHANGASLFLLFVYIHMGRGLYFRSYVLPRVLLWSIGVVIFIILMGTAFLGYTLIWGQMSFWGATVITNLVSAVPVVGPPLVEWLWGGFSVGHPTINKFFAIHFVLPFALLGLVLAHLIALHASGSTSRLGSFFSVDKVTFHPYFTLKDVVGVLGAAGVLTTLVSFYPNYLGHPDNYLPADPLVTPAHIVPEWYFLPFYAILRTVPDKLLGVLAMGGSLAVLFILPLSGLMPGVFRSAYFSPIRRLVFWLFVADFVLLGWLGTQPVEPTAVLVGQCASLIYAAFFAWTTVA